MFSVLFKYAAIYLLEFKDFSLLLSKPQAHHIFASGITKTENETHKLAKFSRLVCQHLCCLVRAESNFIECHGVHRIVCLH